jgi:hypothetical protein
MMQNARLDTGLPRNILDGRFLKPILGDTPIQSTDNLLAPLFRKTLSSHDSPVILVGQPYNIPGAMSTEKCATIKIGKHRIEKRNRPNGLK